MFVKTENHGIINLNCYSRVDVVEHNNAWLLKAFIETSVNANFSQVIPRDSTGFPLAEFSEEIQARYSFCRLYSALEARFTVWDPCTVESFSGLWNKAKNELSAPSKQNKRFVHLDVLKPLELEITGLREITITSDKPINKKEKGFIESKIKDKLGAVDPMLKATWKIDWKDTEEVIL